MSTNNGPDFRRALEDIYARDAELAKELATLDERKRTKARVSALSKRLEGFAEDQFALGRDAYEYRLARPVLTVRRDALDTVTSNAEALIWRQRLLDAGRHVRRAIDAVGRIEVQGHPREWIATAFLVGEDVIATNQHVANEFVKRKSDDSLIFKLNRGNVRMKPFIDFLEEEGVEGSLEFQIKKPLHVERDGEPDIAFLRVVRTSGSNKLPEPLSFFAGTLQPKAVVATIGYPARDSRVKHAELIDRTFGDIYDKKRVAPGQILRVNTKAVVHDCSVLRGNSGSPVILLDTGEVVGVHMEGEFLADNFAVPAAAAAGILDKVPASDDA
jgi:endonuclease G